MISTAGAGAMHLPILAQGAALISPVGLFVLAIIGAIGMVLLLPSKKPASMRLVGGAILLAVGIVVPVVVGVRASRALGAPTGIDVYFWIFSAIAVLAAVRVITHRRPVYSALYFVLTVMASAGLFVLMWAEFMAAALVLVYAGAILVTYVFVIMLAAEAHPKGEPLMQQHMVEYDLVSREPVIASAIGFALLGMLMFVVFDRPSELPQGAFAAAKPAAVAGGQISQAGGGATLQEGEAPAGPGAGVQVASARQEPRPPDATRPPEEIHASVASARAFEPIGSTQRLGVYLFDTQRINLELAGLLLTVAMVGAIVIAHRRVLGVPAPGRRGVPPVESEVIIGPATPIDDNPHSIPVYGTANPRQKEYPET